MRIIKFLFCLFYLTACAHNPEVSTAKASKKTAQASARANVVKLRDQDLALGTSLKFAPETPSFSVLDLAAATGSPSAVFYPGGAAGLIGGIIAHSIISSSVQSGQNKAIEERALKRLEPYQSAISGVTEEFLSPYNLPIVVDGEVLERTPQISTKTVISAGPIYLLSADGKSIEIQNSVKIYSAAKPKDVIYQNTISLKEKPITSSDVIYYWNQNNGKNLKDTTKRLFDASLLLALEDHHKKLAFSSQEISIKYAEDGIYKVERGYMGNSSCGQLFYKTLRGWIKRINLADANCP